KVSGVPVRAARVTTDKPPTWESGRQASHLSLAGSTRRRAHEPWTEARTASWVSTTPFGRPVLPLVATTRASPASTVSPARSSARRAARARPGMRGSTGSTASPASHACRRRETKACERSASTATRRPTADRVLNRMSNHSESAVPAVPLWQPVKDYRDIRFETAEGIAKITINRPEVRNAFRPQTLFELSDAFRLAQDDPGVGVIVLTGEGTLAFCSGGDQRIRGDDG